MGIAQAVESAAPVVLKPKPQVSSMNPFTIVTATQPDKMQQTQQAFNYWAHALSDLGAPPGALPISAGSMAQAYNGALGNVSTEFTILSHNDAYPPMLPTYKMGQRLKERMKNLDVAYFCGSSRLCGPRWQDATPYLFGTVINLPPANAPPGTLITAQVWQRPARIVTGIRVGDGYCMVVRTEAAKKIGFDTSYGAFHHYDTDFGLSASKAGLRVGVICDVYVVHQSSVGYQAPEWEVGVPVFLKKWKGMADPLPVGIGATPASVQGMDGRMVLRYLQEQEQYMAEEVAG